MPYNGAFTSDMAIIKGADVYIFPEAYIGEEVTIGNHVYIGGG